MPGWFGILDGAGAVWGVRFPDVPGCTGGGATPDDAIADATVALRDVIGYRVAGGFEAPIASSAEVILSSGEVCEGERLVSILLVS